jgi:queuine/archaeosine tRNA-ribosyltransferase
MKLPENIQAEFKLIKEKGDIKELMKITGIVTDSGMSQVMSGKVHTHISKIALIKKFVLSRKKQIKSLESEID